MDKDKMNRLYDFSSSMVGASQARLVPAVVASTPLANPKH
jgi:hypothetical protein